MSKYVSISVAAKTLGVSIQTLRRWDEEGTLVADQNVIVRGFGLMIGVELPKACGDLVNIARDEYHTIINVTAGSVVRLLPTLNITKDQADQLIERLVKMIKAYLA
jgi:acetylornithine/N-succinyldiaminopimelate aminotransferase